MSNEEQQQPRVVFDVEHVVASLFERYDDDGKKILEIDYLDHDNPVSSLFFELLSTKWTQLDLQWMRELSW